VGERPRRGEQKQCYFGQKTRPRAKTRPTSCNHVLEIRARPFFRNDHRTLTEDDRGTKGERDHGGREGIKGNKGDA
jgi:hypothetical protein